MPKAIEDALDEEAKRLDELHFQLGDVLDVKASIILVLATFLGTVSGQVLSISNLDPKIKVLQVATVAALGAAVVLTAFALRIREFEAPPLPENWEKNLSSWRKYYADYENSSHLLQAHFEKVSKELTSERIKRNRELGAQKADLNKWAFRATAVALATEFSSLALLVIKTYSSGTH